MIVADDARRLIFVGGKLFGQKFVDGAILRLAVAVVCKGNGGKTFLALQILKKAARQNWVSILV